MGRSKDTVTDAHRSIIEQGINDNKTFKEIFNILKKPEDPEKNNDEFKKSESFLRSYIKRELLKAWDTKEKKWISYTPPTSNEKKEPSPDTSPNSTSMDMDSIISSINDLKKFVESAMYKIYDLENAIKKIDKHLAQIKKDNPYEKLHSFSTDFLKIYSSKKTKKSISINSELANRITDHLKEELGLDVNDSMAIDTALIFTLYNAFNMEEQNKENLNDSSQEQAD